MHRALGQGGADYPSRDQLQPLLTITELSERLAISERTIRRMVGRGRLPCVRLGRQLRFIPGDVLRWLAARKEG